jgi:hypothetical protein
MGTITCPKCRSNLKLTAALPSGRRVRCPKCATVFVPGEEEAAKPAQVRAPSKPKKVVVPEADEEDFEIVEEPPARRARRPAAESEEEDFEIIEEDRPARRRRRTEDEDEFDDRPPRRERLRREPAPKSGKAGLIVGLAVGGSVLLIGLVVGVFFLVRSFGDAYSKHEAASQDALKLLTELADAMESVKDPESAKVAAVRINKVCDQLEELEKRVKALPKLSAADDDRLKKKFQPEVDKINQRAAKAAFQAGANSRGEPSFLAAVKRLEQVGKQLQAKGI